MYWVRRRTELMFLSDYRYQDTVWLRNKYSTRTPVETDMIWPSPRIIKSLPRAQKLWQPARWAASLCPLVEVPVRYQRGLFLNGRKDEPRLVSTYLENAIDALAPRVPHGAQPIPCHRPRDRPRKVCNDKAHCTSAQSAHHTPKLPRRLRLFSFRKTLLPQHLLKDTSKLLIAETLFLMFVLGTETKWWPRKAAWGFLSAGYLFCIWVAVFIGRREAVVWSSRVVVAPASGIWEGIVGVVYLLEFLGASRTFGRVWSDSVGMWL